MGTRHAVARKGVEAKPDGSVGGKQKQQVDVSTDIDGAMKGLGIEDGFGSNVQGLTDIDQLSYPCD